MERTFAPEVDGRTTPQTDPGAVTAEKIVAAVEQIIQMAAPLKVIAFGSRARGDHRPDSDLDLAVMLERCDPEPDGPALRRADINAWMSIDLLVYSRERHEFMRESPISVHDRIATEGVTLYDAGTGRIDSAAAARLAGR